MCIVCIDQIKGVSISLSSSIYHVHILKQSILIIWVSKVVDGSKVGALAHFCSKG